MPWPRPRWPGCAAPASISPGLPGSRAHRLRRGCVDPAGRNQIAVGSGANRARARQVEDAALGPATLLLLQMEVPAAETAG